MAEYTNLESLEGLQVGDIIDISYKRTKEALFTLDPKGYKIKIELDGYGATSTHKSGRTVAIIDTTDIPKLTFYTYGYSCGVAYGEFSTYDSCLYYRLLVAGAQGAYKTYTAETTTQKIHGGGEKGSTGTINTNYSPSTIVYANKASQSSTNEYYAYGGTQTEGAYFGYSGDKNATKKYNSNVGHGWYGGGYVETNLQAEYYGYGGGSGFIIGQTTTTYPAGYLDDDTALQTKLANAISDAETVQGGSTYAPSSTKQYTQCIITIVDTPKVSTPKLTPFYYKDGKPVQTIAKKYINGKWETLDLSYYNGTDWIS